MEKIVVLIHWAADNIRHAGTSVDEEEGFTFHNMKMNYTNRYGVCKGVADTLISFLHIAGFEAYLAMTVAGSRTENTPADYFNYCVAVMKLADGTYISFDPTQVPFYHGLWSSAERQQDYLSDTPGGSDLCLTPVSASENHHVRIATENKLDAEGMLRDMLSIIAKGQSGSNIRRIFT